MPKDKNKVEAAKEAKKEKEAEEGEDAVKAMNDAKKDKGQGHLDPKKTREQLIKHRDNFFAISATIGNLQEEISDYNRQRSDILKDVKKIAYGKNAKDVSTTDLIKKLRDL